jgi:hypothetical protein
MVAERLGGELDHTAGGDRLGARPLDEPELEGDEHRPLEARDVIWWCGTRDQRRGQWPLGTQPSGPRGADVEVSLTITLATGASGGEESVTIARPSPCAACDGSGALPGTTPGPCQARGGSGQRVTSSQQGNVVIKHVSACAA